MLLPGDKVIIKRNFWNIEPEKESPGINASMKEDAGKEFIVYGPYEGRGTTHLYKLNDNKWVWHEDWLLLVDEMNDIPEDEFMKIFE